MLVNRSLALLLMFAFSSLQACGSDSPPASRTDDDDTQEERTPSTSDDDDSEEDDSEEVVDDEPAPKPATGGADAGGKKPAADKLDASTASTVSKEPDAGTKPAASKDDGGGAQPAAADGTCCPDGKCVCRGEDPTADVLNKAGPYKTAKYSSGFKDGAQFAGATIYHPTDAEPPLSGVVFCPGFTALQDSLADYGPFFASHGIVLMIIDTNTVLDTVDLRAPALMDALASLKAENDREGSPLQGKLSKDRYGIGGWSMGGGGTWIAAGEHPELKSAITIAGHHATAGGAMFVAGKVKVPTLMLAGSADSAILGGGNQSQDSYKAIPADTPKIIYEMQGKDHFGLNSPVSNKPAGYYALAWQKTFLEGDVRYRKFLLEKGPMASTWTSNIE